MCPYRYALNDQDKTFELSFGNLKGGGRYRFSLDRNQLALVDGDFSGADTLGDDIVWTLRALAESAQGRVLAPEKAARGVTLLSARPRGAGRFEATDTPEAPLAKMPGADDGDGSKSGNDDGGAGSDKADATPAPDTSDKADDSRALGSPSSVLPSSAIAWPFCFVRVPEGADALWARAAPIGCLPRAPPSPSTPA